MRHIPLIVGCAYALLAAVLALSATVYLIDHAVRLVLHLLA
jgi:hypothetical protein